MNMVCNVMFDRMAAEVLLENRWIFGNEGCKGICCNGKMIL